MEACKCVGTINVQRFLFNRKESDDCAAERIPSIEVLEGDSRTHTLPREAGQTPDGRASARSGSRRPGAGGAENVYLVCPLPSSAASETGKVSGDMLWLNRRAETREYVCRHDGARRLLPGLPAGGKGKWASLTFLSQQDAKDAGV